MYEPPDTPLKVCRKWVWQLFGAGQCCISSCQDSGEDGRVPCGGSVASPMQLMVLPTAQVRLVAVVSMSAVGAFSPAEIGTVPLLCAPRVSITVSAAVKVP